MLNLEINYDRAVSPILAIQSILSVLQILDSLHITIYPMIHRTTVRRTFSLGFSLKPVLILLVIIAFTYLFTRRRNKEIVISASASIFLYIILGQDISIAFLSLMLAGWILFYYRRIQDYATWLLALLTMFEGLALIHWILLPLDIPSPLAWFADLETSLFYVLAPIAPLIATAIMCMWFLKPLIEYLEIDKFIGSRLNLYFELKKEKVNINPRILLAMALLFSIIGALYPYSHKINPNSVPVGVDVHWYIDWMAEMGRNPYSAFTIAKGSRPVMLLIIYIIQFISGFSIIEIVKYLPTLLNPLLAFSVYFMVSYTLEDKELAALASLFTALGFATTVGMYSYFLTNILVLSIIFSSLAFLFKAIRTGSKSSLVSASVLGSLAVFTHPWTFIQYYAATALFLGYTYLREKWSEECLTVLIFLGFTGLVDLVKSVFIGGLGGFGSISSKPPILSEILNFWNGDIFTFRLLYGGLLSNIVLLCLAALGVYMIDHKNPFKLFLTCLLTTSFLYYVLSKAFVQSRILYNTPFGVFSALGFTAIIRGKLNKDLKKVFIPFVVLSFIVYFFRSLANLV